MLKTNDIRNALIQKYKNGEFVTDKTGQQVIEIIGATFIADSDTIIRKPNMDYVKRELEWYKSQSLFVHDIPGDTPKIWEQVSSKDGKINSNYGNLIFSEDNYNQFYNTIEELRRHKNSRRATMIYNRPSMHYQYNTDGMSDFVCTYANQFFIRDDKLISHYIMRSNDAVFGYGNDYHWAKYVHELVYNELLSSYPELQLGDIIWTASSFHVYDRHFKHIEEWIK